VTSALRRGPFQDLSPASIVHPCAACRGRCTGHHREWGVTRSCSVTHEAPLRASGVQGMGGASRHPIVDVRLHLPVGWVTAFVAARDGWQPFAGYKLGIVSAKPVSTNMTELTPTRNGSKIWIRNRALLAIGGRAFGEPGHPPSAPNQVTIQRYHGINLSRRSRH